MNPAETRKGLLLAAAAFTCWGLLSPGNEILLREISPMWMQVFRGGIAMVLVATWLGRKAIGRALKLLQRPEIFAALLVGPYVSFAFFVMAQTMIPAAFTTLGFYTAPLWTVLLARSQLGERVGVAFVPTAIALLAGGYLALTGGGALPVPNAFGLLLAILAGVSWAWYAVLIRRHAPSIPWKDLFLASLIAGTVAFVATAAITEPFPDLGTFSNQTWTWLSIQVAIPTIAALALFQMSLRHAPAGQVSILVGFELAGTLVFAWWLLDARFTAIQWTGMAIVLVAVTVYLWYRDRLDQSRSKQAAHQ